MFVILLLKALRSITFVHWMRFDYPIPRLSLQISWMRVLNVGRVAPFYLGDTRRRHLSKRGFRRASPRRELLIAARGKAGKVPTPYPRPWFLRSWTWLLAPRAITSDLVPPRARGGEERALSRWSSALSTCPGVQALPSETWPFIVAACLPPSVLAPRS